MFIRSVSTVLVYPGKMSLPMVFVQKSALFFFLLYRFLELETSEVKLYSLVQKKVVNSIKALCKTVNQKMLLNNLHDTRICNQLIEPESTEEKWKGTFSSSQPQIGSPEKGKVLLIFLHLTIETLLLCKISYFEPTKIEKGKKY